jgi:hypothetical protein
MTGARAGVAIISGLTAAALSLSAAPPAQAAVGPGWRIVSTHSFGGCTSSMWGTGQVLKRTEADAAIWAYGPVG